MMKKSTQALHDNLADAKRDHKIAIALNDDVKRKEAFERIKKWERHIDFYETDRR